MKLCVITGSFAKYQADLTAHHLHLGTGVYQTVQTGAQMMDAGIDICKHAADEKKTWPEDMTVHVHTNNGDAFNGIRLAVKRGIISHEQVKFVYIDDSGIMHYPEIDEHGRFNSWPDGFFDAQCDVIAEIM